MSRAEALALHEARLMICPDCGNPIEVCSDPDTPWYPQKRTCWASAVREAKSAEFADRHRDLKRTKQRPFLPTDGVSIFTSRVDLHPDEEF